MTEPEMRLLLLLLSRMDQSCTVADEMLKYSMRPVISQLAVELREELAEVREEIESRLHHIDR
jgi:hypothetical protein